MGFSLIDCFWNFLLTLNMVPNWFQSFLRVFDKKQYQTQRYQNPMWMCTESDKKVNHTACKRQQKENLMDK